MLTCYTTYTTCCVGKLNRPTDNENSTRICLVLLKDTAHYAISELRKDILLSQNVTIKKTFTVVPEGDIGSFSQFWIYENSSCGS